MGAIIDCLSVSANLSARLGSGPGIDWALMSLFRLKEAIVQPSPGREPAGLARPGCSIALPGLVSWRLHTIQIHPGT